MPHNFPAYLPADVLQDSDLTYGEKVVYWAIAARANGKKEMWATNRRIGDDIGMSKNRVSSAIKKLVSKGYLKSEDKDGLRHIFTVTADGKGVTVGGKGVTVGGKGVLPQAVRGVTVGGNQKDTKEEVKVKKNIYMAEIKEIVSYLNEKSGKAFRPESVDTKRHISARLNEGFSVEDFKKVINTMSSRWKDDEKMDQFLRPSTLFSSKFEGYLNIKTDIGSKNSPSSPIGRRSFAPCIECGVEKDLINNLCEECRSKKNG